jgi:hypothetical protein
MLQSQQILHLAVVARGQNQNIRNRQLALSDAPSAHENLGLQKSLAVLDFTLHVVDKVSTADVGIETVDHDSVDGNRTFRFTPVTMV